MAIRRPRVLTRQASPRPSVRTAARVRRLSDKVRVAFHAACDEGAVEIAERLLVHLDTIIHNPSYLPIEVDRRRPESLAPLGERLANLLLWRVERDH
jgi:hypothetical protein